MKLNLEQKKELVLFLRNKYNTKSYIKSEYNRIVNNIVHVWKDVEDLKEFTYDYIENIVFSYETLELFKHLEFSIDYEHYFNYYLSFQDRFYFLENSKVVVECE